ncbi:hypothetical protein [Allofranklinella schreckenbergeri]|uniref:hypothetical protein n=1 Tax=Allofranklinella schreckenbergeri TaxID=1076744 RepID=UPI0011C34F73|nr:hypothetical protein [Allofranklinella schreckenbergeri]
MALLVAGLVAGLERVRAAALESAYPAAPTFANFLAQAGEGLAKCYGRQRRRCGMFFINQWAKKYAIYGMLYMILILL